MCCKYLLLVCDFLDSPLKWCCVMNEAFKIVRSIYGSITSWQIDGETVETVRDFISGGSKITADGDYSHKIKRCLLLRKKVMTNLDSILKQSHYFAIKGPSSQRHFFPVVMYGCESLTIKKAEHWRIDAFVGEDSWASRSQGDPTSPS